MLAKEVELTLKAEREAAGGTEAARLKAAKSLQQHLERIVSYQIAISQEGDKL